MNSAAILRSGARWARRLPRLLRALALCALVPLVALVQLTLGLVLARPLDPATIARGGEPLLLLDRRGEQLASVSPQGFDVSRWTPLAELPAIAASAVIESEDHGFWRHRGVDGAGIARAVWLNLRGGRLGYGGSTLTMQVARMILSEGAPRTFAAKAQEALLALRLERALTKHELLEQWLNRAYFGNGARGLAAAAQRYFGKPARALSTAEAVLLACLPRAPTGYDPQRHLAAALRRRDYVLALLQQRGALSASEVLEAKAQPLDLALHPPAQRAPHFAAWVVEHLTPAQRRRGGTVRTTLDLRLQDVLARRVAAQVAELGPRNLQQAGMVVLDTATSEVLAMVGSADFDDAAGGGQLNIVTRKRHPGSALKPFVYAAAIERGASPVSLAWDVQTSSDEYFVAHGGVEHGPVRFREALASSYNFAAVDVLQQVGVSTLMSLLAKAQVAELPGAPEDYGLRLALGAAKVRLLELTAGYGFLVRGGKVRRPRGVLAVEAPASRVGQAGAASGVAGALERPPPGVEVAVLSEATSWLGMDMLADPDARRPGFGSELPLDLPFRVAAKTGTARGFADTWAVAATREVLVGAWAGTFDGTPTQGLVGMDAAAVLVRDALLTVAERGPLTLPPRPPGIEEVDVCPVSGLRPGPHCPHLHDYVPAGKAPQDTCDWHRGAGPVVYPPRAAGWQRRRPR